MQRLEWVFVGLSLVLGCAQDGEPAAKQPSANAGAQPEAEVEPKREAKREAEVEPEPVTEARISVSADEAAAAGLPRLGFSLETTGTGMSGAKLGDGVYLRLSGPPGGPMILRISPATIGGDFSGLVGGDQVLDATLVEQRVELLGAPRRAVAWITGSSMARTSWCAVIIGPDGASPGDPALLLEVGIGYQGDAVECSTALDSASLQAVVASLKLEP